MIALSVAAVLAVFLLYTSLAGGGTPSLQPSELKRPLRSTVSLAGKVVGAGRARRAASGLRFRLRDVEGTASVPVVYTGSVPDLFALGRDIVLEGRAAKRRLRRPTGLDDHEVPVQVQGEASSYRLAECLSSGARRSSSRSGWRSTRSVAGACAARRRRRRLAASAQNALIAAFARHRRRLARPRRGRTRPGRLLASSTSPSTRRRDLPLGVHALGLLERPGGLAAALAARPHRLLRLGRRCSAAAASRDLVVWVVPRARRRRDLLRLPASSSSRARSPRRPRPLDGAGLTPEPPEPVHARAPADALPRLRRAHRALGVRDGRAARARRTDERWIVATRRWTLAAWTFLGVGQLLGAHWAYEEVGWGGYYAWDPVENAALMPWLAATAFLHSVMIQEKRGHAEGLEHDARRARVRAVALRHVPDALRRRRARSTRSRRARSGRGSSASSCSSSALLACADRARGCRCCGRRRGSSRSSRARRRSSTTTCCSSRSA